MSDDEIRNYWLRTKQVGQKKSDESDDDDESETDDEPDEAAADDYEIEDVKPGLMTTCDQCGFTSGLKPRTSCPECNGGVMWA